eukprot:SRR837773.10648.p2 GENE.SRR837773.10648~~SRR837773.10648.p2  ORF type:complete len:145 (-),score=37.28 SRR837773.10648:97-483(-)
MDTCLEAHPENRFLPAMAGILLCNSGSWFRWLDMRSRGKNVKCFLSEPGSDVYRGITLAMLYVYLGRKFQGGKYRNKVVVLICLAEIILEFLEDMFDFDLFAIIGERLRALAGKRQEAVSNQAAPAKA